MGPSANSHQQISNDCKQANNAYLDVENSGVQIIMGNQSGGNIKANCDNTGQQ